MRNLRSLDRYRMDHPLTPGWIGDEGNGVFKIPSVIDGAFLTVIASNGEGWDHVSVSRKNRCPNWPEMEQIASLFFLDTETAMQLHVPPTEHINLHPWCLHWWRPQNTAIPKPPSEMVGVPGTLEDNRKYLEKKLKESMP